MTTGLVMQCFTHYCIQDKFAKTTTSYLSASADIVHVHDGII